jgi:hypothetical protein
MLSYNLNIENNILTVKESLYSFFNTKHSYWYYDIVNWKCNLNGKENEPIERNMDEDMINWVKTCYLPKVIPR